METPDHYSFQVWDNPSEASAGELYVLFSGQGSPLPGHRNGPGIHDYALIHTVSSGRGVFRWRDAEHRLEAGDTFVIFPGELFFYEADEQEPWTYEWVAFRGYAVRPLLAAAGLDPASPVLAGRGCGDAPQLYGRLRDALAGGSSAALSDLEAAGWLRLLLCELARFQPERMRTPARSTDAARRQVDQAVRWLQTHYAEPVSIQELARRLGYHRTHLSKLFRAFTGLSPMQYLGELRMSRAKDLLATDLSVEQIASSCGYADPLYFSRHFRRSFGLSPTAYRQGLE
ncbi:AraC family transcriptional regulator [Paenibacillus sp. B01]|uniref:AraC family transcriptional regulator n=1 Tax=Paenibacillus sp. B01 TaxID=2660554 RepID=UPI00129B44AF|nr:AraC family transcriptional regulator [Paenibacillus sp. B01]QGG55704.1 AraC family transcriptional regulator [Paenibacillus sp. B01]